MRNKYKEALNDPEIAIRFISSISQRELETLLKEHPEDFYLSEWEYMIGGISFRYHLHDKTKGAELKDLYDSGERAGNPFLFGIYSKKDLEEKLHIFKQTPSQDRKETHY